MVPYHNHRTLTDLTVNDLTVGNLRVKGPDQWVDVKAFGAKGDGSTDDTVAIQAAINSITTTVGGGIIFFPSGFYIISTTLTISKGCMIVGSGTGAGSGTGNSGGTVIRTSSATAHVFEVTGVEAVVFRDLWIDASVTRTASGAGIKFTSSGTSTNNQSRVINVTLQDHYYGIHVVRARDLVIDSCFIQDFTETGIYFEQDDATDSGDNVVTNCVIWDLNIGTTQAAIRYDKGGTITITNNKILRTDYGIRMVLDAGPTGTMIIRSNSIEEQDINAIRIEQGTTTTEFSYLLIQGNQLQQTGNPASLQSAINIVASADADPWIAYVSITDNVIAWGSTRAFDLISVQDGEFVLIAHNIITALGNSGPGGITVGGSAATTSVIDNIWTGIPTGMYVNGLASDTVLREVIQGLTQANVPSIGNGSEIYVTDGKPNTDGTLASGGSGALVRRINGTWYVMPDTRDPLLAKLLKVGGTATRATTEGTNHIDIFNGTAPVGTLANGYSEFSSGGNGYAMNSAGTQSLLTSMKGSGRSTAQTAAVASVATFTVGSADASFMIMANIDVTTATAHNFTMTCAYTDEGGTARTLTLTFAQLAGTLVTAITNVTGAGPYEGVPLIIRCQAATAITLATTGTFTTVTYNVEGFIQQVA